MAAENLRVLITIEQRVDGIASRAATIDMDGTSAWKSVDHDATPEAKALADRFWSQSHKVRERINRLCPGITERLRKKMLAPTPSEGRE